MVERSQWFLSILYRSY